MLRMNLLPAKQIKRIRLLVVYQGIIFSGFILILLIAILIVFLGGFLIFLNFNYQIIEKKITIEQSRVVQTETVKGIERKVNELNEQLSDLRRAQARQSDFYYILDNIYQKILIGIQVQSIDIDKNNRITISGYAADRETLLKIKEILENSSEYKDIDFPLSNLVSPKDINFRFSFIYQYEY